MTNDDYVRASERQKELDRLQAEWSKSVREEFGDLNPKEPTS